ncbi:MAG: CBS domain-containing protein [Candidatus Nitrosomirales archaeon]|jgi:CBS domain-containing protein
MDQLRDIMIKKIITITREKTAQDAAKLMAEHGTGSVIVVDGDNIAGIVTERDLVRKVCTKDVASSKVPLSDVMSSPVITAEPDMPIETAVQRMFNNKIRRLPILENGKLVGIVTVSDLVKHLRTKSLIEKTFE